MIQAIRRFLAVISLSVSFFVARSQPANTEIAPKEPRPFSIQTAGKQVTIKSSREINHIMVWTAGGNRVVEQKDIHASSYSFTVPFNANYFFLMVGLRDGKIYTEKIGVR